MSAQFQRKTGISGSLTLLFAVAGGAAVGNLYWAQPLLGTIGTELNVPPCQVGLLITVSQVGYALGVFFLVPLGDMINRRRMIPAVMALAALSLAAAGIAPIFAFLLVAMGLVGLTTISGQMLTPLAGDLATDQQRGPAVSTVASGIMLGLLVSRAVSGIVADVIGWRSVFFGAGVLSAVLAILLIRYTPTTARRDRIPYGKLLLSVLNSTKIYPAVPVILLLGAPVMAVFTIFWIGLTFLLTSPLYSFSVTQIGLISLVGVTGAVAAQRVGWRVTRGLAGPATGAGLALTTVALIVAAVGQHSIVAIFVAIGLISVGIQSVQVLLQTSMLSVDPGARSRLNTILIVTNFIGGAIGSATTGVLWPVGGWTALMTTSVILAAITLAVWFAQRRKLSPH